MKTKYNLFLFVIFLSLKGFGLNQNEVLGEEPTYRAIVNFLKDGRAYNNDGSRLFEGDARAEFLRKIIQWSQRLEEQTIVHLVKNLSKTSLLAKLLYKLADELPEDFRRETAIQCQNSLATLLNPEDEDLPFNQRIRRYKAYGHIWWAQLSIRVTGVEDAATAWDHLNRAENYYPTKVAKLWQLHLILKSNYSPFNNPDLDIAHARTLYNTLAPVQNEARRGQRNAALNNLAVALNNAEENILAADEGPAPLEVHDAPVIQVANLIEPIEEAFIPMLVPDEPSEPMQPDSINDRENRQMLRELGEELRNRELEAAMEDVDGLLEFVIPPNNAQINEDNQDSNSDTEPDTDEELCEIHSYGLAPEELDCKKQKEELSCQKKEEASEEEGDELEQCLRQCLLEMQRAQQGVLSVGVRKSLQEKFALNPGQLNRALTKVKKKLNLKTEGLEKYNPELVKALRERLVELQTKKFPKGENEEWQNKYNINKSALIKLMKLLRKELNTTLKKSKTNLPSEVFDEVQKEIKIMLEKGDKAIRVGAKKDLLKRFNINNKKLSDVLTKERISQNVMEQITAKREAAEETVYQILKEKRDNNQRKFNKGEKKALEVQLGLNRSKMTKIILKVNKKLDTERGEKKFDFTEEHKNYIYNYLKKRREQKKIKTCEPNFYQIFKNAFQINNIGKKAIEKLIASENKKLDNEGISHEFNDEHKQYVISFPKKDTKISYLKRDFNNHFKLSVSAFTINNLKLEVEGKSTNNKRSQPEIARKIPASKKSKNS